MHIPGVCIGSRIHAEVDSRLRGNDIPFQRIPLIFFFERVLIRGIGVTTDDNSSNKT